MRHLVLLLATGFLAPATMKAQSIESAQGPVRLTWRWTAPESAVDALPTIQIMERYRVFEEEFEADFGLKGTGDGGDSLRSFTSRWDDRSLYRWIQWCTAMYERVQDRTRVERKGFDVNVGVDDLIEGRFELRMSRTLE